MDDTVLFLSAYNSTQYKATNWFLRKLRNVIPHKKKQMQSLLEKHHLSFVATDETITSVDGKMEVTAQYDYVHIYLQNLFCSPNLPIETHNLLNYIKESEPYKKHAEALHLKISYLTAQNELKKSRNSAILNVLLYIISLLSAIGTLDVIEAHFGVPFKYSFIIVVTLFILGLFWGIIEYRNHRKL